MPIPSDWVLSRDEVDAEAGKWGFPECDDMIAYAAALKAARKALEWCDEEFGSSGPAYSDSEFVIGRHEAACLLHEEIRAKLKELES